MKQIIKLGLLTLALLLLFGCQDNTIVADDSGSTAEGINAVVNANNQFAFDLYSQYKASDENIFFSPYSISTALAMTYEGAKGQTADEIASVFHFPENMRPNFAAIYNSINKKDKKYLLSTANALWAQQDYAFLEDYINTVKTYYGGEVTNLDFVGETEKSRKTINSWVEDQTNDKIKDLIPTGMLSSLTRLVLTNAIYFKGDWILEFDKKKTREADFMVSPEKTVKAQMMALTGNKALFNYGYDGQIQIIELPYKGNEVSMLVILPRENDITIVEQNLDKLNEWKSMMREQKIDVYMPKFKFETKYFMSDALKEMGMPLAFTWPGADFSGMDGTDMLYIDFVIHQAYIDVNEKGTEAAAATAVGVKFGSAGPPEFFRADHPFIFLIQEKETGNILFMGRMMDPTK